MIALQADTLYVCTFSKHISHLDELLKISDNLILSKLIELGLRIERFDLDLQNMFENYHSKSTQLLNTHHNKDNKEWVLLNTNTLKQAKNLKGNFLSLEQETKEMLAHVRVYYRQRIVSSFRIVYYLQKNVFPKVNRKKIADEILKIKVSEN